MTARSIVCFPLKNKQETKDVRKSTIQMQCRTFFLCYIVLKDNDSRNVLWLSPNLTSEYLLKQKTTQPPLIVVRYSILFSGNKK